MIARHPRFLAYPLAAVLLAVGAMMGLGTAAGASTTSAASANSAAATAAAKGAIEHLLIGQHGANHTVSTSTQPGAKDAKSAKSANGLKGKYLPLPDHDHFSVLEELANPDGKLTRVLHELIAG